MYCTSLDKHDYSKELNFVYSIRVIMCQHCMNSDTNTFNRRAFLKKSANLQKLRNEDVFKLDTYCLSRQKAMEFKVMNYFSLQTNPSSLNLVLSSMKWSLPYPTRLKRGPL